MKKHFPRSYWQLIGIRELNRPEEEVNIREKEKGKKWDPLNQASPKTSSSPGVLLKPPYKFHLHIHWS